MADDMYTLTGTVVTGDHYGEKLGYPTANLDSQKLKTELKDIPRGVYGGIVECLTDGTTYKAGIVIGAQDTHEPPKVEAHLLDFSGNLYNEELTLHLKEYIREIREYTDEDILRADIARDLEKIKQLIL